MNFSPKYIVWDTSNPLGVANTLYVAMHELSHALGFTSSLFLKTPYTTTTTLRGKTVTVVNSATVLAKVKEWSGCPTAVGMEIEDEGGVGTAGSHWERRNAGHWRGSYMTGMGSGVLDAMTLAMFQDSGQYTVNWSAAEPMVWGNNTYHGKGCGFFTGTCNLATAGQGEYCTGSDGGNRPCPWCSATNSSMPGVDRRFCGYCDWNTYGSAITPAYFAQFSPNTMGGGSNDLMDFCPKVLPWSNRVCIDTAYSATSTEIIYGWTFATGGRCLSTVGLIKSGYTFSTA